MKQTSSPIEQILPCFLIVAIVLIGGGLFLSWKYAFSDLNQRFGWLLRYIPIYIAIITSVIVQWKIKEFNYSVKVGTIFSIAGVLLYTLVDLGNLMFMDAYNPDIQTISFVDYLIPISFLFAISTLTNSFWVLGINIAAAFIHHNNLKLRSPINHKILKPRSQFKIVKKKQKTPSSGWLDIALVFFGGLSLVLFLIGRLFVYADYGDKTVIQLIWWKPLVVAVIAAAIVQIMIKNFWQSVLIGTGISMISAILVLFFIPEGISVIFSGLPVIGIIFSAVSQGGRFIIMYGLGFFAINYIAARVHQAHLK